MLDSIFGFLFITQLYCSVTEVSGGNLAMEIKVSKYTEWASMLNSEGTYVEDEDYIVITTDTLRMRLNRQTLKGRTYAMPSGDPMWSYQCSIKDFKV